MKNGEQILLLQDVVKVFPGVRALDGVHLDVRAGEVHALCGENGAGKSTLMKIISGAQPYTSGKMLLDGKEVRFHSTKDAERQGIAMIYQEFNMVADLSVAENLFLGRLPEKKAGIVDWNRLYNDAQQVLDRLGLTFSSKAKIRHLSVAQVQMAEIAKCLTIGARLIIMDEPTAALTDSEIKVLFGIIDDLKKKNIAVLYISHRMDEIFEISDRITVFRDGRHIDTKETANTSYDEIVAMMVGKQVEELYPKRSYTQDSPVFELRNVSGKGVDDVSLTLHKGEILGIAGLMGSGNIELSKMIYGATEMKSGQVLMNGKPCDCTSPAKSLKAGLGFVSDDRKQEGLVLVRSVKENVSMSSLDKLVKGLLINQKEEKQRVNAQVANLNIKISDMNRSVGNLSGGNQQKVVFAKVLEANGSVCIFDEPTRGVDVGAKAEIYAIMDRLSNEGKSIILISSDLPELIGMSDRILVMREGKVVKEILKAQASQSVVLAYASGGVSEE